MTGNRKKRILIICGGTQVGGAEIATVTYMRELKNDGYSLLCVINGWNDGTFRKMLLESGIAHEEVKLGFIYISKWLWTLQTLAHYPGAIRKLRRIITGFQPDVVWHSTPRTVMMAYPVIRKEKNILTVHDFQVGNTNLFIFRFAKNLVQKFVAVSEALKSNLIEAGANPDKVEVVKNGIVTIIPEEIFPMPVHEHVRFGIAGQIHSRKGHDKIIDALIILRSKEIKPVCVFVGAGDQSFIEYLKERIKRSGLNEQVKWEGYLAERDDIYRLFDVALVPSTAPETLSLSAIEAGLYYKPSIVTNMGGLPEVIVDGVTGFIIAADEPLQLAEKMEQLISDPGLIITMGKKAHDHIVKNFDAKYQTKKLSAIIDGIQE